MRPLWIVVLALASCERDGGAPKPTPTPVPGPWTAQCDVRFAPRPDRDPSPMCLVPAAEFVMGRDAPEPHLDLPPHRVRITRGFYIDQYEVTTEQMVKFANTVWNRCEGTEKDACMYEGLSAQYVDFDSASPTRQLIVRDGRGRVPAQVFRDGAIAYCQWAGKQLPTEAQWVLAAYHDPATGKDRLYPWGDTFIPENTYWGEHGLSGIEPVGSYPGDRSPVGAMDMGGNEHEWVLDGFTRAPACSGGVCVDPEVPLADGQRCDGLRCGVVRGGWLDAKTISNRDHVFLDMPTGFRCVFPQPAGATRSN
jgi:formylglycine-generating enzyme required for sulfatase activity